jgi:hypothetical protein
MPMSTTTVPIKTPLGHEELRQRTQKLGQRHRTILFLIDGQRPLGEVLKLAEQAGAAASHFDELVRLGLVELPIEAPPDEPVMESVAEPELVEWRAPETQADEPEEETAVVAPPPLQTPEPRAQAVEPVPAPLPSLPPVAVLQPIPKPVPVPASSPAPVQRRIDVTHLPKELTEAELLQQVRELLTDSLRLDAPLFSARTFVRVRNAQSTTELIDLVWEIESHLTRARHSRREMLSLERARELLGLGNTLAADDDTRPGYLDE